MKSALLLLDQTPDLRGKTLEPLKLALGEEVNAKQMIPMVLHDRPELTKYVGVIRSSRAVASVASHADAG